MTSERSNLSHAQRGAHAHTLANRQRCCRTNTMCRQIERSVNVITLYRIDSASRPGGSLSSTPISVDDLRSVALHDPLKWQCCLGTGINAAHDHFRPKSGGSARGVHPLKQAAGTRDNVLTRRSNVSQHVACLANRTIGSLRFTHQKAYKDIRCENQIVLGILAVRSRHDMTLGHAAPGCFERHDRSTAAALPQQRPRNNNDIVSRYDCMCPR